MERRYLADSERYALYGLDQPAFLALMGDLSKKSDRFINPGVREFVAKISKTPGIGEVYRDHGVKIVEILQRHYSTIISADFLRVHSGSHRAAIAALVDLGTDMRALYAGSAHVLQAFSRMSEKSWFGGRRALREADALQRLFLCDVATAYTYDQHRVMQESEFRRERLSLQLVDFRGVIEGVSGELSQASMSVDEALVVVSNSAAEALTRSRLAADATQTGNRNLTSSAASTEELAISINELTRQSEMSRDVVGRVERAVGSARSAIGDLDRSAQMIGSIVDLISRIAEQTNLLSLNATIEAARAGEAGRGFAIVAQEVKTLASQTTKATQDIVEQIAAVQSATARSVAEIGAIGGVMEDLSRNATEIAAAISQQNGLTAELSRNLHDTVDQVVSASEGYQAAAALIESASAETARLRDAVGLLSRIGGALVGDVDSFAERIKAA